jgi:hypothetical protein
VKSQRSETDSGLLITWFPSAELVPDQADAVRELVQGNFPAYCGRPVRTGDWLSRLAAMVVAARELPPVDMPQPGPWELWPYQTTPFARAMLT